MGLISIVIKIVAIFIIILIALLDLAINLVSFIPVVGDALETTGEIVLEIIQFLAFGVLAFSRGKFDLKGIIMIAAFAFLSVVDVALNAVSLIPVVGDIIESIGEGILEMLQIALAFLKMIF